MFTKTKALLLAIWRVEPSYGLGFAPIYMIEIPWIWITDYWLKKQPALALLISYIAVGMLLLPTALALLVTLSFSILMTLATPFVMLADCVTQTEKKPKMIVSSATRPHVPKPLKFAPTVYPSVSSNSSGKVVFKEGTSNPA